MQITSYLKYLTMKKRFLVLGLLFGIISCNKDNSLKDYRDIVTGDYNGKKVRTYWIDTIVGFGHDTSNITLTLSKSNVDSIVNLSFDPAENSNNDFTFKLVDGEFVSTTFYHPPILKMSNDSLYFKHQAGLGPYWTECFTKKIK
jgi:hypothetical protein